MDAIYNNLFWRKTLSLAIFDLDNTLLGGDSDYLWGRFLVEQGHVDGDHYERENQRYYDEYKAGTLDIYEFLRFSLKPLAEHDMATLLKTGGAIYLTGIVPIN
jgi:phosphoserine phosphatase